VLGLGIETCGMDPAHNVNPNAHGGEKGACYQVRKKLLAVFPQECMGQLASFGPT
jgi:hypothetical protein